MSIFDHSNYKEFTNAWIASHPSGGRGMFRKIAVHLNVHSTLISHIFKGSKELSLEQGINLCSFLELTRPETDYFLLLLNHARSGSQQLKNYYRQLIEAKQEEAQDLKNRIKKSADFTPEARGHFYSNWYYSAVRMCTDIPNLNTPEKIAEYLGLPFALVLKTLNFLVEHGLCVKKNGKYHIGPAMTHVESNSPFVLSHHKNWRLKAIDRHPQLSPSEISFTFPVTVSASDAKAIRAKIIKSPSEEVRCLNIDWLKISP